MLTASVGLNTENALLGLRTFEFFFIFFRHHDHIPVSFFCLGQSRQLASISLTNLCRSTHITTKDSLIPYFFSVLNFKDLKYLCNVRLRGYFSIEISCWVMEKCPFHRGVRLYGCPFCRGFTTEKTPTFYRHM